MTLNGFKIRDEISRILDTQTRTQAESRLHSLIDSCVEAARVEERKRIARWMQVGPSASIIINWVNLQEKLEKGQPLKE